MASDDPANTRGCDGGRFLFRGDDGYRGGPIGRALGTAADEADIQDFADHVRKDSNRSSRHTSFTTKTRIARKFTTAADNRSLYKVEVTRLRELQEQGQIRIWYPDQVYDSLRHGSGKGAKRARDTRTAMRQNHEVLIEGQVPPDAIERVSG
jgi:hypothetical protein